MNTRKELIALADELCRRANGYDGMNPHTSSDPTAPNYLKRDHDRAEELRDVAKSIRKIAETL